MYLHNTLPVLAENRSIWSDPIYIDVYDACSIKKPFTGVKGLLALRGIKARDYLPTFSSLLKTS